MSTDRLASRHRPCARGLAVVIAGVALVAAATASAQEEFAADVLVDNQGKAMKMHVTVGPGHARMDMTSDRGEVSIVYGPDSMLMILHPQRMYMEFTRESMERMQQMMGAMGQRVQDKTEAFDPERVSFRRTGRTETIGEWSAFEVEATNEDSGETTSLWLTEEADVGLFELFANMADKLGDMRMPGMRGGSPIDKIRYSMQYARANGMPAGALVRMVGDDGTTMTLQGLQAGPVDPSLWQAPEGYRKQQMPGMQG